MDQSPIGRSPRSNPVTYIKAFDEIRELFAEQPLARRRKYSPGHFLLQRARGALRGVRGSGPRPGGDGLHGRRVRSLRGMRRHTLPARGARRPDPGALDPRRAAVDGGRGDLALPAPAEARHRALAPPAGRARLPAAGPAGDHAVGRRGAAAEDRPRAGPGGQAGGAEALHPRRADHRPPPRRRADADAGARPPGRRGTHRRGHRAPSRRDQAGRLDHRSGARGRQTRVAGWSPRAARRRWPQVAGSHTGRYLKPMLAPEPAPAVLVG